MLLRLLRLALRVADRAVLLVVNVAAPVRSDVEAAVSEGSKSAASSPSARHSAAATHSGPFVSDNEARLAIAEWDREWKRRHMDDVCTAEAWCDPWQRVRGS